MRASPAILLLVVLSLTAAVAGACPRGHHGEGRQCWANMKTLVGAMEMFALDKPEVAARYKPGLKAPYCVPICPAHLDTLLKEGYLQTLPRDRHFQAETRGGPDLLGSLLGSTACPKARPIKNSLMLISWGNGLFCLGHGQVGDGKERRSARQQLKDAGITDSALLSVASDEVNPFRWHDPETTAERLGDLLTPVAVFLFPALFFLPLSPRRIGQTMRKLCVWTLLALLAGAPFFAIWVFTQGAGWIMIPSMVGGAAAYVMIYFLGGGTLALILKGSWYLLRPPVIHVTPSARPPEAP